MHDADCIVNNTRNKKNEWLFKIKLICLWWNVMIDHRWSFVTFVCVDLFGHQLTDWVNLTNGSEFFELRFPKFPNIKRKKLRTVQKNTSTSDFFSLWLLLETKISLGKCSDAEVFFCTDEAWAFFSQAVNEPFF